MTRKAKPAKKSGNRRSGGVSSAYPPLPALTIYQGASRIGLRGGESPVDTAQPSPPTIAVIPSTASKRRPAIDDRPFDPTGLAMGSLRLKPYFEEDSGYASNPLSLPTSAKGSMFENSEIGLSIQSDWTRSDLHGALRGGYADYFRAPSASAPYGDGTIGARYDISRDLSVDSETHFNISTQTPGSVSLPAGAVLSTFRRPLVETFGASLGGAQKFGDLAFSLHGAFARTAYGNSSFAGGVADDLSSDDSSDWGLRGRAAYEISPIIAPFVEVDIDRRIYDSTFDSGGYRRNSNGVSTLGGATIALTHQFTGEASAGYGSRTYQDGRLPDLSGPLFNASLIWAASPLTTISLKANTTLADTTTPGASGAVSRNYAIALSHELLRDLTLTASAGYTTDVYSGVHIHDETTNFGLRAEYSLSREVALKVSATRTQFTSSVANANYGANVFMLGLRLQR